MSLDRIVEIVNASVSHADHVVLTNVNFTLSKGELVYLVGRTASGKSSLIKTMYGELPFDGESGFVAGFDLKTLKNSKIPFLRRKIGIVFQDFQLLTDRSVHENLLFVLKATGWTNKVEIAERIHDVLEKVDLVHKEHKMPYNLSGGEQQRVVIARAMLNDPELILADEPTGNLDPESTEEIMKLLIKISQTGRAVLMATHNHSLLKKFPSKTLKCEAGKLIEITESDQIIDFSQLMNDDFDEEETIKLF
jgi:cell division transport system ATP-binding protein